MRNGQLHITPLAGALGAEISGIDLAGALSEQVIAALRKALLDHLVIFFRDQNLETGAFMALAERFGEPVEYPMVKGLPDFPKVIAVAKYEQETVNFGGIWHSDTTYLHQPPMGSMLLAREVPPYGGDTIFANQYLAYETLSPGLKRMLEGVRAVNSSAKADVSKTREDRLRTDGKEGPRETFLGEHPVVRTHPETGRKALFVNIAHTARFADMTEEESAGLLHFLFQHQVRPEFTCRFAWRPGSLAFWDNRCTQHNPVNDYHGYRRIMHRITLAGDTPF